MSDNPLHPVFQKFESVTNCVRIHLSRLLNQAIHPVGTQEKPSLSLSSPQSSALKGSSSSVASEPHVFVFKEKTSQPLTREELGRATWTFLHTLAAQYPEKPTRQQKKDVKELMGILSRMYPCRECADHFKEVLRANPVEVGSQVEFSRWLCHVHNVVNRSLAKPIFPCERVDARWGKLECEQRLCDLQGTTTFGEP